MIMNKKNNHYEIIITKIINNKINSKSNKKNKKME